VRIPPSIPIGLQPGTKVLRIERNNAYCEMCSGDVSCFKDADSRAPPCGYVPGSWAIWTNPSADFTHGTYIKLCDDGTAQSVTLVPEGYEEVRLVKPADR
jgi:hypothetical protein